MEVLHIGIIATLLSLLDANSCYFLKVTNKVNWDLYEYDQSMNESLSFYKTVLAHFFCNYDEICCGQSCCPDQSVTPKYYYDTYNYQYDSSDSQLSTSSWFGVSIAVFIGVSICMSCFLACCKQQKQNERQNVTAINVQPIVAYSSVSGAVIIRQVPSNNPSSSSSGGEDISNHDPSQPYGAPEMYGSYSQDTRGNGVPSYESANLLQITEPPPSYAYVMSNNYPTYQATAGIDIEEQVNSNSDVPKGEK